MQKIEIILSGPEAEQCAELIKDLAIETMKHYDVTQVSGFCCKAPIKKGYGELLVPDFMQCKAGTRKDRLYFQGRKEGSHES